MAREAIVARTDDERQDFLRGQGFTKSDCLDIIKAVTREEGHPPASVFDFVQGITAMARCCDHQDDRLDLELKAKRLLNRVAR
jgi:hypothetical protein